MCILTDAQCVHDDRHTAHAAHSRVQASHPSGSIIPNRRASTSLSRSQARKAAVETSQRSHRSTRALSRERERVHWVDNPVSLPCVVLCAIVHMMVPMDFRVCGEWCVRACLHECVLSLEHLFVCSVGCMCAQQCACMCVYLCLPAPTRARVHVRLLASVHPSVLVRYCVYVIVFSRFTSASWHCAQSSQPTDCSLRQAKTTNMLT